MNCKAFTEEQWTRIGELMTMLMTMGQIEKGEAETHSQRNAVNAVRRMLFEKLDRALAAGQWREVTDHDSETELPF